MASAPDEVRPVPFSKSMKNTLFSYAQGYTPLNHGSYCASHTCVRRYQQDHKTKPKRALTISFRKKLPKLLDDSRAVIAPTTGVFLSMKSCLFQMPPQQSTPY